MVDPNLTEKGVSVPRINPETRGTDHKIFFWHTVETGATDQGVPLPLPNNELVDRVRFVTDKVIIVLNLKNNEVPFIARSVLSWLRNRNPELTPDEVMTVLQLLKEKGRLGEFLNLISYPDLRVFLETKKIPWEFIRIHWEPSATDSSRLFIGFMQGAAEDAVEGLLALGYFLASPFIDNLAAVAKTVRIIDEAKAMQMITSRDMFWDAIGEFWNHPLVNVVSVIKDMKNRYESALWRFDFMEAGRILGHFTVQLITLPTVARSIWQLIRAINKVSTLSLNALLKLVSHADLKRFLIDNARQVAFRTQSETWLSRIGEEVVVVGADGTPQGKFLLRELEDLLRDESSIIDEFDDSLEPRNKIKDRRSGEKSARFRSEEEYIPVAGTMMEAGAITLWKAELEVAGFKVIRNAEFGIDTLTRSWARRLFGRKRGEINPGPDMIAVNTEKKIILVGDVCPNPRSWIKNPLSMTESIWHFDKTVIYAEQIVDLSVSKTFPEIMRGFVVQAEDWYWELESFQRRGKLPTSGRKVVGQTTLTATHL